MWVALPPFVIFKGKTMNQELANGEVPGTVYGVSENGWMTQQLSYNHSNGNCIPINVFSEEFFSCLESTLNVQRSKRNLATFVYLNCLLEDVHIHT